MLFAIFVAGSSSCRKVTNPSKAGSKSEYFVSVWIENSNIGLNSSDDKRMSLQSNHNLIVRIIKRGNPPKSATNGMTVSYEIANYKISKDNKTETEGHVAAGNMVETKGLFIAEGIHGILNDTCNYSKSATITVKTSDGRLIAQAHLIIPAFDVSHAGMVFGTSQPPCEICHYGMNWTNPGEVFYGKPKGKGNPFCIACHQSSLSAFADLQQSSPCKILN